MTETMPHPAASGDATPCPHCGAPLAADQRYCLNCGTRRGEPRVDMLAELAPPPAAAPVAAAAAHEPSLVDRFGGPAGIAAVVLAALGVGLLIGESGDGSDTRTVLQRAPVVNVATPTGAQGAALVAPATTTSSSATDAPSGGSGSGSSSSSRKPPSKAKLKRAAAQTKAAQDAIKNAPKQTGTGGKPPAKDHKAAGGGSDAESIG